MSRQQGVTVQTAGMLLIVTVMLADRYLFSLRDHYILACALMAAALLIIGIRTVKRWDDLRPQDLTQPDTLQPDSAPLDATPMRKEINP